MRTNEALNSAVPTEFESTIKRSAAARPEGPPPPKAVIASERSVGVGVTHADELQEGNASTGSVRLPAKGDSLSANEEDARVLEFDGQEEGSRRYHSFCCSAGRVSAARIDRVNPEIQPVVVGHPVQEVEVVLADKELRAIYWIRGRSREIVIHDRHGRTRAAA